MTHHKLHFGPGHGWEKPDREWLSIDIDPIRGDIVLDFNKITRLPLSDESVSCIYRSHVFEHMSIFATPIVFSECFRVLMRGGYFRLVLPDVRRSIEEYMKDNVDFPLFKRRIDFIRKRFGYDRVTLFEALRSDFLSPSGQVDLLGERGLAHQNAWDYESIVCDLARAGFNPNEIKRKRFRETDCLDFAFEGAYPSEANEEYRSIYVEAKK